MVRRAFRGSVLVVLAAVSVIVCGVLVATPAQAARTNVLVQDIAYGGDAYQFMRVGRPAGSTSAKRPTVIFVHGGGWVSGGMKQWQDEAGFWVSRGWLTVNASYRLGSPTGPNTFDRGREMLADMASVITAVRSFTDVDRSRILVVGDSAGGHLASWAAGRYPTSIGALMLWSPVASPDLAERTAAVHAADVVCLAACLKQRDLARRAHDLFGFSARTTSPLSYLGAAGKPRPKMWIAASADEWIPYATHGGALCTAIGGCTSTVAEGAAHGTNLRDQQPQLRAAFRRWAGTWAGLG